MQQRRVGILLLATYGIALPTSMPLASSPFAPQKAWSLSQLRFLEAEVVDTFRRYNATARPHGAPEMPETFGALLSRLCGAHPGLLRQAIFNYARMFVAWPQWTWPASTRFYPISFFGALWASFAPCQTLVSFLSSINLSNACSSFIQGLVT